MCSGGFGHWNLGRRTHIAVASKADSLFFGFSSFWDGSCCLVVGFLVLAVLIPSFSFGGGTGESRFIGAKSFFSAISFLHFQVVTHLLHFVVEEVIELFMLIFLLRLFFFYFLFFSPLHRKIFLLVFGG